MTNDEDKDIEITEPIHGPVSENIFTEPTMLDVEEQFDEQPRYLKNVGKLTLKKIFFSKKNSWIDESGKKYNLMVVSPTNRAGDTKWSDTDLGEESKMALELKLTSEQKAYVYYDAGYGTDVTKKGWERILKVKVMPINHTFVAHDFPHIIDYECGLGAAKGSRRYTIMVGSIIKVSNSNDFEHLWKSLGILDEVNEKGQVIKENQFTLKMAQPDEIIDTRGLKPLPVEDNAPGIISPSSKNPKTNLRETHRGDQVE